MPSSPEWVPLDPDLETVLSRDRDPLLALSQGRIPAIILRQAYNPEHCKGLIRRFIERGLMRDPGASTGGDSRTRIDIGTSLGGRSGDKEGFLQDAAETHALFNNLFDGFDDPIRTLYQSLSSLAGRKEVKVAREPDGRLYGPAIFRIHYEGHAYRPHINHVTLREGLFNYAVARFEHQFAGILCFQNALAEDGSPQALIHRCLWTPEVQPHLEARAFHAYTAENRIENYRIGLQPGDLTFFNSRMIHEVPAVPGPSNRIVLAVFIGYSPECDDIFVWS